MTVTWLIIYLAVAATSTLSGLLGMGGGMILMGILALLLPTGSAMVLHGVAQLVANGSRVALHLRHVEWKILPAYGLGAAGALGLFSSQNFVPERWMVYLVMGAMPWFAVYGKRWMVLEIEKPWHAAFCGLLVTVMQLASGVSGPALDIFFLHSRLSRHRIVASKATTQSLGHALKLVYYGPTFAATTISHSETLSLAGVALLGTVVGSHFLEKTNDASFQLWSRRIILVMGLAYLVQGLFGFISR